MEKQVGDRKNNVVGAVILIVIGVVALVGQYFEAAWIAPLILLGLALVFILAGIVRRESGFIIPGGILFGVGLGVGAVLAPELLPGLDLGEESAGGWFMMAFALGWVLIPVLSILFTNDKNLWALIPGGIMALIGFGLLFGGMAWDVLEFVGRIWPLFLIAGGVYLLYKGSRRQKAGVVEKQPTEKFEG